jgi:hypothetical protein
MGHQEDGKKKRDDPAGVNKHINSRKYPRKQER